jgi:hypothetical protein
MDSFFTVLSSLGTQSFQPSSKICGSEEEPKSRKASQLASTQEDLEELIIIALPVTIQKTSRRQRERQMSCGIFP